MSSAHFSRLLDQARHDRFSLGALLDIYRSYLKLLARIEISGRSWGVDPSDVAQEVFLRAHRAFTQFRGSSERELTSWLRQILARCIVEFYRRHRGRFQEEPFSTQAITARLDYSSAHWTDRIVSTNESPSQLAERRELTVQLASALEQLPAEYREAIILRQLEGHSWNAVAQRMGRTTDSVRKLWSRGIMQLRSLVRP